MNIEDINIGMMGSQSVIITDELVSKFSVVSGDYNPVHLDDEYAKKSRYKKKIAHGLLSGSLFSGIFGTKIPGEGCVYASQSFNFLRPVYIGDEVLAVVEVISVDIASKRVTFKTVCTVRAKKVIDGIAEIFIP